ncbi:MAG: antibiotic biosynthesis monooxygenase [Steroidobacteraceae bacterium]
MILEMASLKIQPGQAQNFEAAFLQAEHVIASSPGHLSHQLQRSLDVANHYMLLVQWRTLEDHVVGFRESPLFVEWRRRLGPFFAAPPEVEHYELFGGS